MQARAALESGLGSQNGEHTKLSGVSELATQLSPRAHENCALQGAFKGRLPLNAQARPPAK